MIPVQSIYTVIYSMYVTTVTQQGAAFTIKNTLGKVFLNKETSIEIRYSKFQNIFLRLFCRFEEKKFLKLQYSVCYFNPSYDLFSHHKLTHTSADFLFIRPTNFYFSLRQLSSL